MPNTRGGALTFLRNKSKLQGDENPNDLMDAEIDPVNFNNTLLNAEDNSVAANGFTNGANDLSSLVPSKWNRYGRLMDDKTGATSAQQGNPELQALRRIAQNQLRLNSGR